MMYLIIIWFSIPVQLLHKLSISAAGAAGGTQKLLKVIKNPITDHLPVGCRKVCMSFSADKCIQPRELVIKEEPLVVVIGAMAHGQVRISNWQQITKHLHYSTSDVHFKTYVFMTIIISQVNNIEAHICLDCSWGILKFCFFGRDVPLGN